MPTAGQRKFFYLDLYPDIVSSQGHQYRRKNLLRWGAQKCFFERDLYTTKYGQWISTEIEQKFFGPVDASARPALDYFANFKHPSADGELFNCLVRYMSIQKLRTPKGLAYLSNMTRQIGKNHVLIALQKLQNIFCAIWSECVWTIADASRSETKFLISDHPVTVYNQGCFPGSAVCRDYGDPQIWFTGTHTLFPLTLDKILILTNLSWTRNPYGNPTKQRPNSNPFRAAMFNFTSIQTGRRLSEQEVIDINYIIKMRAHRYLAAAEEEWLYPEKKIATRRWDRFGNDYLLMPDPRSMTFSSEIVIGYKDGAAEAYDAYGRRPWQSDYDDKTQHSREWETFLAFQGEFARRFGPKRRGLTLELGNLTKEEDDENFHKYHLSLEQKHRKHRPGGRRGKTQKTGRRSTF